MAKTAAPTDNKTETKAERFDRLAVSRVNKALDAIAMIGGLAAKGNYDYTDEKVAKIFGALETEMTKLQAKFKNPEAKATEGFSF
jgi:hypothetical protein